MSTPALKMRRMTQIEDKKETLDPVISSQRARFLESIADGQTVSTSVKGAGVSRATVYRWRSDDPDFATAWYDAHEDYLDSLETEARTRALHSDTMLIFLLKSYRPGVFGDGKPRESRPVTPETPEEMTARIKRELEVKRTAIQARIDAGDKNPLLQLLLTDT